LARSHLRNANPFLYMENKKSISIAEIDCLSLFGHNDRHLSLIEENYGVTLVARGDKLLLNGPEASLESATNFLNYLIKHLRKGRNFGEDELCNLIYQDNQAPLDSAQLLGPDDVVKTYNNTIRGKTEGQINYMRAMAKHDIVFAIGPAGTGKTYLAVAMAAAALRQKQVSRIVLTRPAVEAGERLGFLPGAIEDKVDPYLRPLFDALQDLLEPDRLHRFQETKIVEIAPLAYMRGRTLNDAFIILDEAQNTTPQQMKMFLTRLGSHSKAVITGDITQRDLPQDQPSGLIEVQEILKGVADLAFIYLNEADVVRNALVQQIVKAYDQHESGLAQTT
jgi:phosphate starvation-inducible PhoH-like protein